MVTACTPSAPPPCRDKCAISASESEKEVSHEGREESVEETSEVCHTIGNQGASRARGSPPGLMRTKDVREAVPRLENKTRSQWKNRIFQYKRKEEEKSGVSAKSKGKGSKK